MEKEITGQTKSISEHVAIMAFLLVTGANSLSAIPINNWTNMNPIIRPHQRDFHSLCYDSTNKKVILFGGRTNSHTSNYIEDTWAYDYQQNEWTNMKPAIHPSFRNRHSLCYDNANKKVILFGGDNEWYMDDTWAYDYAVNKWTNMNPPNPPHGRYYHSLCYDSVNKKVILFGGAGGGQYNDTWAYDYTLNQWTNMNPANPPGIRYSHYLCYDSSNKKVILFGGRDNFSYFNDTWVYDFSLNQWTDMNPATHPSARAYYSLCYDSDQKKAILFGGWDGSSALNDTWVYDYAQNKWMNINTTISPPSRETPAMCYNNGDKNIILFGGWTNNLFNYGYANDTWVFSLDISKINSSGSGDSVTSQSDLHSLIIGPSPYAPNDDQPENGTQESGIIFAYLTSEADIEIYTITGRLIAEFKETDGDGKYVWKVPDRIASGTYICRVSSPAGDVVTRKIIIIK